MSIAFTDAEQAFADSAEGRAKIAHAKMVHDMGRGHSANGGEPFTDAQAARAIRAAISAQAEQAAMVPVYEARAAVAKHLRDAAHAEMVAHDCRRA